MPFVLLLLIDLDVVVLLLLLEVVHVLLGLEHGQDDLGDAQEHEDGPVDLVVAQERVDGVEVVAVHGAAHAGDDEEAAQD